MTSVYAGKADGTDSNRGSPIWKAFQKLAAFPGTDAVDENRAIRALVFASNPAHNLVVRRTS